MTGLPDPVLGHPRGRNAGDAGLDREAVLLEDAGEVLLGLEFLEAELAEAEDHVDHLLAEVEHRQHVGADGLFQLHDPRVRLARPALRAASAAARRPGRALRLGHGHHQGHEASQSDYPPAPFLHRATTRSQRRGDTRRASADIAQSGPPEMRLRDRSGRRDHHRQGHSLRRIRSEACSPCWNLGTRT